MRLETRAPKSWGRSNHEVRYFIKVPKSIRVEARTTNGGVRLNGIANEVTASSVNGGIKGDGLSGHIDANTTNGGVEIGLASVSDGGVTARDGERWRPAAAAARPPRPTSPRASSMAASTSTTSLALESTGEKSRRRLEGQLNGGGSRIELSTTNGGIHITGR